jgi:preprotein translocase subunit SecE
MANKLSIYIKESIAEMKKVTWPTKKETKEYTFLVIGISVFIALLLGMLDFIFTTLFSFLINKQ